MPSIGTEPFADTKEDSEQFAKKRPKEEFQILEIKYRRYVFKQLLNVTIQVWSAARICKMYL